MDSLQTRVHFYCGMREAGFKSEGKLHKIKQMATW